MAARIIRTASFHERQRLEPDAQGVSHAGMDEPQQARADQHQSQRLCQTEDGDGDEDPIAAFCHETARSSVHADGVH